MFCIIAEWDAENKVTRYNCVEIETEAKRLVDRLRGDEPTAARKVEMQVILDDPKENVGQKYWAKNEQKSLPIEKVAPDAYYAAMSSPGPSYDDALHQAAMWDVNPLNKTVAFNTTRYIKKLRNGHMRALLVKRDAMLADLDKTINRALSHERQGIPATGPTIADWDAYAEKLRKLPTDPATIDDPSNPTWPEAPE